MIKGMVLQTIQDIKERTGRALANVLGRGDIRVCSEQDLVQRWLSALQEGGVFYEDGWYAPPPHGVISLFGKPEDSYRRICIPSFRPETAWPLAERLYESEDVMALYASPVHRMTHLIGDFGLSLYAGRDRAMQAHFEDVLRVTLHIAKGGSPGMPFRELYQYAVDIMRAEGFLNSIESSTDAAGTNIGHTIPLSFSGDPASEAVSGATDFAGICDAISKGRIFVNGAEGYVIAEDMAFTVEPRLSRDGFPSAWFHLTVIFEAGEARIVHGFKPVFECLGLDRLLRMLPG